MNINNSKLAADTGKTNNDTNDVFGMDLFYNTYDFNLTTQVYWDGKLALAKWMAMNASTARGFEQAFVYSYDGVNRYTGETYSERATTGAGTFTVTHGWDENSIKYDANGNIQALRRDSATQSVGGATLTDQLKYTYNSSIPDQLYTVQLQSENITATYNYTVSNRWETAQNGSSVYVYGAHFDASFNIGNLPFSSYQFISIVQSNPTLFINGNRLQNPVVDGTYNNLGKNINWPFYYTNNERNAFTKRQTFRFTD